MTDSTRTWSLKKDVATWYYTVLPPDDIDLREPPQRAQWFADWTKQLLSVLPPLAVPTEVAISTHEGGEDARVVAGEGMTRTVAGWLASHSDVYQVELLLSLAITQPSTSDAAPEVIHTDAGRILVRVELDPDTGELDDKALADGDAVWMAFTLNTDAYCPRTFRPDPDNQGVARANAPSLREFLHRLEERVGARFDAAESLSFSDQLARYGFSADSQARRPSADGSQ